MFNDGTRSKRIFLKFWLKSLFKVVILFMITITSIYFSGCIFNFISKFSNNYYSFNFINTYCLDTDIFSDYYKFITVLEFIFVSMSTVGFGDLVAINNTEKILTSFLVLFGVALDCTIIGAFNEVLVTSAKLNEG